MLNFSFKILNKLANSRARTGVINTGHGEIQTPSFVPVGTKGSVKSMTAGDLEEIGTQVFFVNTYHAYLQPGAEIINKFGGLHKFIGWKKPLMTDSAGFQVFSLGQNSKRSIKVSDETEAPLVKITEDGVKFRSHLDGSEHFFTPEKSMEIQSVLGADICIAFDECTFYPATEEYAKSAMERTHRWGLRCLTTAQTKLKDYQALYGVVQGGIYKNLREESAKFISNLDFDGIAIGGVSVGESKKEMIDVLDWVTPLLPEEKPRHLLGVGEIDDIFNLVERGVDTFDCVMPTRLGRTGFVLVKVKRQKSKGKSYKERFILDLNKTENSDNKSPIDEKCGCFVCKNYSRAYLHHLFRAKELLAYRLATYHNLFFVEELMKNIRESIGNGKFYELKKEWLE